MQTGATRASGTTGAATLRHVGLVALEAVLIAMLVWIAAMTLAGAQGGSGLVGAADAGRSAPTVSVTTTDDGLAVLVAPLATDDMWVHLSCRAPDGSPDSRWAALDERGRATFVGAPAWGSDTNCGAETGYFSANGRWRVLATTTFATGS
jgi:hypothetical protein